MYVDENGRRLDRRYPHSGTMAMTTRYGLNAQIERAVNGQPVIGPYLDDGTEGVPEPPAGP